jgi:hypothetical protein
MMRNNKNDEKDYDSRQSVDIRIMFGYGWVAWQKQTETVKK